MDTISDEDYYSKSMEFRVWLKIEKNISFEELDTEAAKDIFCTKFVKNYNKGKLLKMYYTVR